MKKINLICIIVFFLIPLSSNAYLIKNATYEAFNDGVDSSANFTLTNPNVQANAGGIYVDAPTGGGRAQPNDRLINMTGETNFSFRVSLNMSALANDAIGMMFLTNNLSSDAAGQILLYGIGAVPFLVNSSTASNVCPGWASPGVGYTGSNFWNLTINLKQNHSTLTAWEIFINETQQCLIYPGYAFDFVSFGDQTTGGGRAVKSGYKNIRVINLSFVAAAAAGGNNITITAADNYDSTLLTSYRIDIRGITNFTQNTTNGTIPIANITHGFYNITFSSDANGTYYNITYYNINVSGQNFKGNLTQSWINLYVNDSLTKTAISGFTVRTNFTSYDVIGGYILLPSKAGANHLLNISSSQYPKQTHHYSIDAGANISFTANMSPSFNFFIKREADNSIFKVNETNTTRLTIYCPNKNIVVYFKNESDGGSPTAKVLTQENLTVDCDFSLMKMDITYPGSSYFRTLIPEKSQQNVTWWLLDLNRDTGVQIILNLIDLTGDFTNGFLRLQTAIGGANEDIIEQKFDITTAVTTYLLKDGLYIVTITSSDGTQVRQLGNLIADTASTKTITFPNIPFFPITILENNISWSYTCNASASIFRLQYKDSTKNTTSIKWEIYNGTNVTKRQILQTFTSNFIASNASTSVTYTFNNVLFNQSYYSYLFAQNSLLKYNITDYESCGDFQGYSGYLEGFSAETEKNIKHYGSIIFLVVWGLLFTARHASIGLTSTFMWVVVFYWYGWLIIHILWVSLLGLIAAISWFVDSM